MNSSRVDLGQMAVLSLQHAEHVREQAEEAQYPQGVLQQIETGRFIVSSVLDGGDEDMVTVLENPERFELKDMQDAFNQLAEMIQELDRQAVYCPMQTSAMLFDPDIFRKEYRKKPRFATIVEKLKLGDVREILHARRSTHYGGLLGDVPRRNTHYTKKHRLIPNEAGVAVVDSYREFAGLHSVEQQLEKTRERNKESMVTILNHSIAAKAAALAEESIQENAA